MAPGAALREGARFGQYELIKRIAVGGMAEIHLAKTSSIANVQKLLALKVINPKHSTDQEFIDMLIDEAKIAVQLSHVNICQTFDLGRYDTTYFIAMEFIDGKDLYQVLVKCADLEYAIPFDIAAFVGMELSGGLHYAHTRKDAYGRPLSIIHRDVSPQNVLVSYDGEVKIVDFGIAKAAQRSKETESGVIKGKFFYMSPEQAWGDPIDHRTDVFSAGICLYEMVCGEMLYQEEKALLLLDKVRKAEIPDVRAKRPDCPQELINIILKALARDADQRYPDAAALQSDLSAFLYRNYPGFNRHQVATFMHQVFGDQRFVLPMPEQGLRPSGQNQVTASHDSLMHAGDFTPESHSVIYDLNAHSQGRGATSPINQAPLTGPAQPDVQARPFPASPTNPLVQGGVPGADFDDDDERTIAEPYWQADAEIMGGVEPTAAIPVQRPAQSRAHPERTPQPADPRLPPRISEHDEQPTQLFTRPGIEPPKRMNVPKQPTAGTGAPEPVMAATVGIPIPQAEIAAFDGLPGPTGPIPQAHPPQQQAPLTGPAPRPEPAVPQAVPQPAPQPASGGRKGRTGKLPPKRKAPKPEPVVEAAAPEPVAEARPKPEKKKPTRRPSVKRDKPKKPNRAAEEGRPTIASETPPKRRGKGKKPRGKRKGGLGRWLISAKGITLLLILALSGYVVVQVFAPGLNEGQPKTATLIVNSTPPGAEVIFNGKPTGQTTPTSIPGVTVGVNHQLALKLKGYAAYEDMVAVAAEGLPANGEYRVPPVFLKPTGGTLVITTDPPGVDVFADGKYIGATPLTRKDLDRERGEMRLVLNKDGFIQRNEIVRWGEEVEVELKFKMERAGRRR